MFPQLSVFINNQGTGSLSLSAVDHPSRNLMAVGYFRNENCWKCISNATRRVSRAAWYVPASPAGGPLLAYHLVGRSQNLPPRKWASLSAVDQTATDRSPMLLPWLRFSSMVGTSSSSLSSTENLGIYETILRQPVSNIAQAIPRNRYSKRYQINCRKMEKRNVRVV